MTDPYDNGWAVRNVDTGERIPPTRYILTPERTLHTLYDCIVNHPRPEETE